MLGVRRAPTGGAVGGRGVTCEGPGVPHGRDADTALKDELAGFPGEQADGKM